MGDTPDKRTKKRLPPEWEEIATEEMKKRIERQDKGEEEPPTREEFVESLKKAGRRERD
jgi:hypothetical protein